MSQNIFFDWLQLKLTEIICLHCLNLNRICCTIKILIFFKYLCRRKIFYFCRKVSEKMNNFVIKLLFRLKLKMLLLKIVWVYLSIIFDIYEVIPPPHTHEIEINTRKENLLSTGTLNLGEVPVTFDVPTNIFILIYHVKMEAEILLINITCFFFFLTSL